MTETNVNKGSPTSFELVIPKIPNSRDLSDSRELTLNIHGTLIPGISLDPMDEHWLAFQTKMQVGKVTFEPWSVEFVVDSELKNWKILYEWMMFMNNNVDKVGEMPRDYSINAVLRILQNFETEIMKLLFVNVWITNLNDITLSYRDGRTNLESGATFSYDSYEIIE